MEVTVVRRIDSDRVRQVCIDNDYYTKGDVRAYERLLETVPSEPTDIEFVRMAQNIYGHSDIDRLCGVYGCDEQEVMESILFNLYNASWTQVKVSEFEEVLG